MTNAAGGVARRLLLTGAVGAALAACTRDPDHAGSGGDGPPFPRTISHQFGGTTLRKRPERIVALGRGDADVLLALGITPTAVHTWVDSWSSGVGPWARPKLGGATPKLLTGNEIDFDEIAALAPDLVTFTRSDNLRATWQRLESLAPTLSGPAGTGLYGTSWMEQTRMIAAVVDRTGDGHRLVTDTEAAIRATRNANPGFAGKTVCVATASDAEYHAYIRRDSRVQLIEALGFTNSPKIENTEPDTYVRGRHFTTVTRQTDPAWLDADLTVLLDIGNNADLRNDRFLNSIPSAKAGRLLVIDDADLANAFSTMTVLNIPFIVERFVTQAGKALGR
jgi:iron complex transport system substrate-binding protein